MAVNQQLTTTRTVGQGVGFERTARITGYLSTIPRFCDSKLAELKDRVLHGTISDRAASILASIWSRTEEAESGQPRQA